MTIFGSCSDYSNWLLATDVCNQHRYSADLAEVCRDLAVSMLNAIATNLLKDDEQHEIWEMMDFVL